MDTAVCVRVFSERELWHYFQTVDGGSVLVS